MNSRYFAIYVISIIFGLAGATDPYYQRITYLSHESSMKAHQLEIVWSESAIAQKADAASDQWTYSILRSNEDSTGESIKNSNNQLFEKYSNYIIDFNGTHNSKSYVAWSITPTCSSDVTTVSLMIRFFSCEYTAEAYYNQLSGSNKIIVNSDGSFEPTEGEITYESQSILISAFLGVSDPTTIFSVCPVQAQP